MMGSVMFSSITIVIKNILRYHAHHYSKMHYYSKLWLSCQLFLRDLIQFRPISHSLESTVYSYIQGPWESVIALFTMLITLLGSNHVFKKNWLKNGWKSHLFTFFVISNHVFGQKKSRISTGPNLIHPLIVEYLVYLNQ